MKEPIVRVEHLSHRYSVQWAIEDINFEVDQKGIVGLLGSNGAGKSTTMNIICGVLNQTSGKVYINGIDTRENPIEAKKNIGFLPQKPPLYMDHNVEEYLNYCAHLRLMDPSGIKKAVEHTMERCGISHFSKRLVRNLSGGYQQRLGIAQAIIHNPKFVVLDEPTNGLDPNQILEIRGLIREIADDHSVLISTHILSEVEALCDEVKMIEQGHLVFTGTIDEYYSQMLPSTAVITLQHAPDISEIEKIPGVMRVKRIGDNQFRLELDDPADKAPDVSEHIVRQGWGLQEILLEKISMDEIFAQLSGKKVADKM